MVSGVYNNQRSKTSNVAREGLFENTLKLLRKTCALTFSTLRIHAWERFQQLTTGCHSERYQAKLLRKLVTLLFGT
jgi:hypothetical protein